MSAMNHGHIVWILTLLGTTQSLATNVVLKDKNDLYHYNGHIMNRPHELQSGSGDWKSTMGKLKMEMMSEGIKMASGHMTKPRSRPCPCKNISWCDVVKRKAEQEIFIFSVRNDTWRHYDWDKITTIATFFKYFDDELLCWAHSRGVKVVRGVVYPKDQLNNITARRQWINQTLEVMTNHFQDGLNVDIEYGMAANETARDGLTLLMKELNQAAKKISPYTQITFDFACTPDSTGRQYDYKGIADVIDFAFVMDYDELGGKYASANSPYDRTKQGMERYLAIGIPGNKLILGAPWYGYWFKCDQYDKVSHSCRSSNHGQLDYNDILKDLKAYSFTGRLWDPIAKSPYFSLKDPIDHSVFQIRYDDPESLKIKFGLISSLGLRGAGNWHADSINYSDPSQVKDMWGAFPTIHMSGKKWLSHA